MSLAGVLAPLASAEGCPNAVYRTGPSAALPDCRAYEMVSPNFTNGGTTLDPYAISPEGSSMLAFSLTAFAGAESAEGVAIGQYRLSRTASGWTATPLVLPASRFVLDQPLDSAIPLDGSTTFWFERGVEQPAGEIDVYAERGDGSIADVGPALPDPVPPGESLEHAGSAAGLVPAGASGDGSRVFFDINVEHWPFDSTQTKRASLYEYDAETSSGAPMLVGVSGGQSSTSLISLCGTVLGGGRPDSIVGNGIMSSHNAVSGDGKVVFFTAYQQGDGCSAAAPPVAELYARVDNGEPGAHTIAISEPSEGCAECDTEPAVLAGARFQGASEDGSRVFFSTSQPLLGKDTSENLYEAELGCGRESIAACEAAGEEVRLKRIVRVSKPAAGLPASTEAEVRSDVLQVSEDGSHVYFVANGVLSENANAQGLSAHRGADNLYVWEPAPDPEAEGPYRIAFIADLCSDPGASGSVSDGRCPADLSTREEAPAMNDVGLWAGSKQTAQRGSNITPAGRFLVFVSYGDLTQDDTSNAQQAFEYDALTERLVRVSVGENGFNDDGNTATANAEIVSPDYTGNLNENTYGDPAAYWSNLSVSEDGSYVFFQSADGLTPQAVDHDQIGEEVGGNGKPNIPLYAQNVYEYHSLDGDIADGNVYLISDGRDIRPVTGASAVRLIGADASGQDVFFTTLDHLVPQDNSENIAIYDARVDGGFPAPTVPVPCSGDACQGALSGAPASLSPGSEFQSGESPPLAAPVKAVTNPKPRTAAQVRAEKLAKALKACRKRSKRTRASCERRARRQHGSAPKQGKR